MHIWQSGVLRFLVIASSLLCFLYPQSAQANSPNQFLQRYAQIPSTSQQIDDVLEQNANTRDTVSNWILIAVILASVFCFGVVLYLLFRKR